MNRGDLARFRRNITVDQVSGCWVWTGPKMPNGYGKHRLPGQPEKAAHRLSYEHYVGAVPTGLQLDHRCRVRSCVNPEHLEPVTGSENTLRQDHAERRVTHCPAGHAYTDENTLVGKDGKRRCRKCRASRRSGSALR